MAWQRSGEENTKKNKAIEELTEKPWAKSIASQKQIMTGKPTIKTIDWITRTKRQKNKNRVEEEDMTRKWKPKNYWE